MEVGKPCKPERLDAWGHRGVVRSRVITDGRFLLDAEWSMCWWLAAGKTLIVRWLVGGTLCEELLPRKSLVSLTPLT